MCEKDKAGRGFDQFDLENELLLAMVDIPKLLAEFKHDKDEPVFDGKLLGTMLKFAVPSICA